LALICCFYKLIAIKLYHIFMFYVVHTYSEDLLLDLHTSENRQQFGDKTQ
jgi:hypothetical protein